LLGVDKVEYLNRMHRKGAVGGPRTFVNGASSPRVKGKRYPSLFKVVHALITILLLGYFLATVSQQKPKENAMETVQVGDGELLEVRVERKDEEIKSMRGVMKELRRTIHKKEKEAEKLKQERSPRSDATSLEKYQKRDKALTKMNNRLKDAVARFSRQILKLKFGKSEPYKVTMKVRYPESMGEPELGEIDLEMASSELMPTAVLYFLNQVDAGLWNGMSFIRNADHVLQADPTTPAKEYHHHDFKQLPYQLESIPFQEYSEKFPHTKYTVGLAG